MGFFKEFKKLLSELSEFAKQTGYTSNHDFFMDMMHQNQMHQHMDDAIHHQQIHQQMHHDMEFTRMSGTGIEFGGFNPDPGMNPGMMNNGMF